MAHLHDLDPAPCPNLFRRYDDLTRPLRVKLHAPLPQMDPAAMAAIQTGAFKPEGWA